MHDEIQQLVNKFAYHTIAQDEAVHKEHDADKGNRHAKASVAAFESLVAKYADDGREALATLFRHEDPGVRCTAAAHLLRYKHKEAMKTLQELAEGKGFVAFEAECSIENWHSGDWELDLEPDPNA